MELLILLGLILLNGIFAMSEMAIVSARRTRLETLAAENKNGAQTALDLAAEPDRFLSTIQIGITLIGVMSGAFGGAAVAGDLANTLVQINPDFANFAQPLSLALVVGLTTYLSLVIGELVPKRIALSNPENIASLIARPMQRLSTLTGPLVTLLSASTGLVVSLLGIRQTEEPSITDKEVLAIIRQGAAQGIFAEDEESFVQGVMRLDEQRVGSVVTPRTEVIYFNVDDSEDTIRQKIRESTFSAYPVAQDSIDRVIGMVRTKDLLAQIIREGSIDLKAIMLQPLFMPESVSVADVLQQFKSTGIHTALVVGEYGGIEGLVRMHDIIEQIFGELDGGVFDDQEPDVVQREDGSWLLDGQLSLLRMEELFPEFQIPEREAGNYETLAGFVMARLGRVPQPADHFDYSNLYFEVMDMDDIRIDKMLVREAPLSPDEQTPEHQP